MRSVTATVPKWCVGAGLVSSWFRLEQELVFIAWHLYAGYLSS